jgi:signal peptidase I
MMEPAVVKWTRRVIFGIGCLALLACFFNPVIALFQSALCFAFASGMRRSRAWAAITATAVWLIPTALVPIRRGAVTPELIPSFALSAALCLVTAAAALALWRNPDARTGAAPWLAFLAVFVIGFLSFQPFVIPAGSMEPTLLIGDHLFVETASWILGRAPQRNEIVAFHYPVDRKQLFVKRVVGVPGDRISFRAKQLIRNGTPVTEPWAVHTATYPDQYRDEFPAGKFAFTETPAAVKLQQSIVDGQVVIPPNSYFVLGDSRDNSLDSRYWGFVDRRDIIGSPVLIYASYETTANQQPTVLQMRWKRLLRRL